MATGNDGMPDLARVGDERTVEQVVAARAPALDPRRRARAGARLRYRQLADQFGVSVTPVRVALKELAGEGLVELRPHAGASVSALSVEELEEVLLTRASLEPFLALQGPRLTDGDVAEMSGRLDEVREVALASTATGTWMPPGSCGRSSTGPPNARGCSRASSRSTTSRVIPPREPGRRRSARPVAGVHGGVPRRLRRTRRRPGAGGDARGIEWTLAYLVEAL